MDALSTAPNADALGTNPAPEAAGNTVVTDPNTYVFRIPSTETDISINIASIPAETRMELLKKSIRDHVTNRTNQANVRHNKKLAPWIAYDEALKADPLQTAVAKPEGERPTVDLVATAAAARADLYEGKLRVQGEGEGKKREKVDPLTKAVTDVVVRELFDKKKATTQGYKWTDAVKEVGNNGIAYLDARIAEKVAAGGDAAALESFKQSRYIKPARIMLGLDQPGKLKDAEGLF